MYLRSGRSQVSVFIGACGVRSVEAYRYAELHELLSTKYSPRWISHYFFCYLFCLFLPYEINVCNYTDYDKYNQFTSTGYEYRRAGAFLVRSLLTILMRLCLSLFYLPCTYEYPSVPNCQRLFLLVLITKLRAWVVIR